jgi:hypothetical protein
MSNNEQTQKSLSTHIIAKQQKTLDLSKNIIAGTVSIAPVEMQLTIQQTFDKALIKSVFKGEAGQIGFSVVNVLVTRFIDSFGFSTKLNPTQIETLTVDILENFQYETLEDIIIFLKMARTGKFGSTGRGVDSNLILGDWFPKYLDKKAEIREQNYQVEKTQFINNNSAVDLYYKNIQKKKEQKKIFDNMISDIDKMVLNMDRTMLEETILDWSKKDEMKPYLDYLKRKRLIIK